MKDFMKPEVRERLDGLRDQAKGRPVFIAYEKGQVLNVQDSDYNEVALKERLGETSIVTDFEGYCVDLAKEIGDFFADGVNPIVITDEYKGANITLNGHSSSFYINEITDEYVLLESVCKTDQGKRDIEMKLNFDSEDKENIRFREELRRVYQWQMEHYEDCKSGKNKPCIGYKIEFIALLQELVE